MYIHINIFIYIYILLYFHRFLKQIVPPESCVKLSPESINYFRWTILEEEYSTCFFDGDPEPGCVLFVNSVD